MILVYPCGGDIPKSKNVMLRRACWEAHPGVCAERDAVIMPNIICLEKDIRRIVVADTWCCFKSDDTHLETFVYVAFVRLRLPPMAFFVECTREEVVDGEILVMKQESGMLATLTQWHIARMFCSRKADCVIQVKKLQVVDQPHCLLSAKLVGVDAEESLAATAPVKARGCLSPSLAKDMDKWFGALPKEMHGATTDSAVPTRPPDGAPAPRPAHGASVGERRSVCIPDIADDGAEDSQAGPSSGSSTDIDGLVDVDGDDRPDKPSAEPTSKSAASAPCKVWAVLRTGRPASCKKCGGRIDGWDFKASLQPPISETELFHKRWGGIFKAYFHISERCLASPECVPSSVDDIKIDTVSPKPKRFRETEEERTALVLAARQSLFALLSATGP